MTAKLINVEGAGGLGKSTCAKYLQESLLYTHKQNTQLVDWLEVTSVGKSVKDFFNNEDERAHGVISISWLLMLYAARRQAMEEIIYPMVYGGVHVIVESFYDSAHVYLGELLGLRNNILQLENLSSLCELRERADHTLFLSSQNKYIERRKAFDTNSYPELMEKISYGNRKEILIEWDKHIERVQKETINDSVEVHVLDASLSLSDTKQHLDQIAISIAKR